MTSNKGAWSACVAAAISIVLPGTAIGQLKGEYPPGFAGLQSGTQAPPGIGIAVPVFVYSTNTIKDDAGNAVGVHPRINSLLFGAAVGWVTPYKVFGANVGGSALLLPFMGSSIEGQS